MGLICCSSVISKVHLSFLPSVAPSGLESEKSKKLSVRLMCRQICRNMANPACLLPTQAVYIHLVKSVSFILSRGVLMIRRALEVHLLSLVK